MARSSSGKPPAACWQCWAAGELAIGCAEHLDDWLGLDLYAELEDAAAELELGECPLLAASVRKALVMLADPDRRAG